jgi:hypothetical protein
VPDLCGFFLSTSRTNCAAWLCGARAYDRRCRVRTRFGKVFLWRTLFGRPRNRAVIRGDFHQIRYNRIAKGKAVLDQLPKFTVAACRFQCDQVMTLFYREIEWYPLRGVPRMARSYSFDQLRKVRIAIVVHAEEPVHLASGVSPNDPRRIVAEKAEKWPNRLPESDVLGPSKRFRLSAGHHCGRGPGIDGIGGIRPALPPPFSRAGSPPDRQSRGVVVSSDILRRLL